MPEPGSLDDYSPVVVSRNAVELRVAVTGVGPRMLFLHGLAGTADSQRGNAPSGYTLASFDQRGHGSATPLTAPGDFAIDEFVADAIAVLDALRWQNAIVCGASMGAAVAMKLAHGYPTRVRALLLVAPAFADALNAATPVFDRIADTVEQRGIEAAIGDARRAWIERGVPFDRTVGLDAWRLHDPASMISALRTVSRWTPFPDLDAVMRAVRAPTVVACWPGDPMHPDALARRIADLASAPMTRFTSVAEAQGYPEHIGAALAPLLGNLLLEAE